MVDGAWGIPPKCTRTSADRCVTTAEGAVQRATSLVAAPERAPIGAKQRALSPAQPALEAAGYAPRADRPASPPDRRVKPFSRAPYPITIAGQSQDRLKPETVTTATS